MNEKKIYYYKIDIIRVIACIAVFLYHLNILKGGFLAVCTFFVLSGYLVCSSALTNKQFKISTYYKNRFKKLYLPLLLVVFITIIFTKILPNIHWINLKQETFSVIFGYNNFWQLSANMDYFTRNINSPFTHLWYISILIQFDLIFPIIFTILKKNKDKIKKQLSTMIIVLITIILTLLFYNMSKQQDVMTVYYNTFARAFSICFGALIALIHYKYNFKISRIFKKFQSQIFFIYCILLIVLFITISADSENFAIFMILTTIITVRMIEYATMNSRKNSPINKLVKFLSKISYEIYLIQYPVIFFMQNLAINNILKIIATILLTLIISIIINVLINKEKRNKIIKIIFCIIVIAGLAITIFEEDHTAEMKELENQLNENMKIIEERNKNYMNSANEEEKKWDELLESMEDEEGKVKDIVRNLPIVGIGDSVLLGCTNELYDTFPNGYFDGRINRNITEVEDILDSLEAKGKLGYPIIFVLGSNGEGSKSLRDKIVERLSDKTIYWPNVANEFEVHVNDSMATYPDQYKNVRLIDWYSIASTHPEYLEPDKVHPSYEGRKVYVKLIYDTIYNDYLQEYKNKKNEMIKKHEAEKNSKIAFYGNDLLTGVYENLEEKIENAKINVETNFKFNDIYNKIKEQAEENKLEHKIVFAFDKTANISKEQYQKLIDLCKEKEIYIINCTNENYSFSNNNVKVIDFYSEVNNNPDYIIADGVHLSKTGNEKLANLILNSINK